MDTRFLYSVNPKKPIRTIKGLPVLRTPKSLNLSKEEVKECLKYGSVYRRFANEARNERVTINSVDRLHNAKFMTEEEYEAFLKANIDGKTGTVINTTVEETKPVEEPVVETVAEETTEEVVENDEESEEEPVVETEDTTEEVVESNEESVEETVIEEVAEEVVENNEEPVVEETETTSEKPSNYYKNNNNKNYGGKNHKR